MWRQSMHKRSIWQNFTRSVGAAVILAASLVAAGCDSGPMTSPDFALSGGPGEPAVPGELAARGPRASSAEVLPLPFFVRDGSGGMIDGTDGTVLLHEAILGEPITTPAGHQVTWTQWAAVDGRIHVKCISRGTHAVLHLEGLIPGGVYTVWNVTFQSPGFTGEFDVPGSVPSNVVGFGPAGPSDGSRSEFRASASGRASVSTITAAGALGSVGEIGACALTDEFEWHVVGLYHTDGRSYGPVRGPEGTRAEQFAFVFRP